MFKLICNKTVKLSRNQILDILKLKKSHWNYSLEKQLEHFKISFKNNDLHNLLYKNNQLIGYTALRTIHLFKKKKNFTFLQFDTLIIHKSFRKKKLSNLLMIFNTITIINKKLTALLYCKKQLIPFYKKFGWQISNNKYLIPKKSKTVMVFN
jgi:predicted GNAT family N-acyltransferase